MDWQSQKDCLDKLYEDPLANDSEIIRIYDKIIKETNFTTSDKVVQFLNEKAVLLLEPELVEILTRNRMQSRAYLLVANNLLNLEDIKDDNGDVLATLVPPNSLRKLKINLGLETTTSSAAAQSLQLLAKQTETIKSTATPTDIVENAHPQNVEESDGIKCFFYRLPLKQNATFSGASSLINRFSFGEPNRNMVTNYKTILLMGATGSGKTTMINAMINYVLGVEWDDPFRFLLIDEDVRGGSQANSQTQGVTAYDIHHQNGFRIPYSLIIVDMPGFGDTGGIGRDKEITSAVKQFFEHQNGIQELDVVGFAVKSSDARLTVSQNYIFNSVLAIFGKDVEDNIRFLVTFSDGNPPLVLEAIKEAKLPCLKDTNGTPCHQNFNNMAILPSQSCPNNKRSHFDWVDGMKNFKEFFNELSDMPTKSLQMTKEVLESRKTLETNVDNMQRNIDAQLMKMEDLRKQQEIVTLNKEKIDANQNFETTVKVQKKVKVPLDNNVTALNCTKCGVTCHFPCNNRLWTGFCPAFWKSESIAAMSIVAVVISTTTNLLTQAVRTCQVCPEKCVPTLHINEDSRWDYEQVEETVTLEEMLKKYKEAMDKQPGAEGILNSLQRDYDQLQSDILKAIEEITHSSNRLKTIALRGDPLTTPEYIQMMIKNEEDNRKPGFEERIKSLKMVLYKAELTKKFVV
ncbi:uncharacterized protein LOC124337776 [Daphnia pulicaria]|uniref:uncharacterized protein LOC124337776 n=1 Tax=Daphnia pulicaria TaxID=35523 RepID=UPI001EEC64A6|nr:uncharacterized protein LOC124337776 [Daphnia pulicaria]